MYTVIAPTNDQLTGSVLDPATITALDDARLANTLKYDSLRLGARSFHLVHSSPPAATNREIVAPTGTISYRARSTCSTS
jgi:hypothetical protein